jgi:hypothetical protein
MQQGAGSLLVLLLLAVPAPAVSWSIPGLPSSIPNVDDVADKWQELLLQSLWEQHRDSMSYCVGSSLADAKELFKESFPSPLPTGTLDDQLCSNSSLIMSHLCSPLEVKFYMKVLLCAHVMRVSITVRHSYVRACHAHKPAFNGHEYTMTFQLVQTSVVVPVVVLSQQGGLHETPSAPAAVCVVSAVLAADRQPGKAAEQQMV